MAKATQNKSKTTSKTPKKEASKSKTTSKTPPKQAKRIGRPPVQLDANQVAQVEALASVLTLGQIADYFGVSRTTFAAICERQPEVSAHYKKGKAKTIGAIAQNLVMQAKEGNLTASIFYLKTQAGWREQAEESGENAKASPVNVVVQVKDAKRADAE